MSIDKYNNDIQDTPTLKKQKLDDIIEDLASQLVQKY